MGEQPEKPLPEQPADDDVPPTEADPPAAQDQPAAGGRAGGEPAQGEGEANSH